MSGTTISGSTSVGVTLTASSQNPLVVTSSGSVAVSSGYAVYGSNAHAWSVYNAGLLSTVEGKAVDLAAGGSVTNAATGLISGQAAGVYLTGAAGSVVNQGTILATTGYGVELAAGGMLTNAASALIQGYGAGVLADGTVTVVNSGTVASAGFAGLEFAAGLVTNTADGTITGSNGILAKAEATIVNQGLINTVYNPAGGGFGVYLGAGGIVTNAAGGVIDSPYLAGVYVETGSGTVINAGTIIGGGDAVDFNGSGPNLLQIDPGAVFNGVVQASGESIDNTLDLAAGSGTGTIYGIGSQYTGFGIVNVGAGASWLLKGSNYLEENSTLTNYGALTLSNSGLSDTGAVVNDGAILLNPGVMTVASLTGTGLATIIDTSTLTVTGEVGAGQTIAFSGSGGDFGIGDLAAMAGTIDGWGTTGTIDLTNETYGNVTGVTITGSELQVTDTSGTYNLQLDPEQNLAGLFAHQSQDSTGDTELTVNDIPCFLRGTAILTPRGEVAVEDLVAGDTVVTASGAHRRLDWIGTGQVLVTPGQRTAATPIIVRKGALAGNVPNRDLRITKGHSLYLDGVLIPAEFLINHRTILWDDTARIVTIYHLELDAHDVLLANGAPAESYRDDGNRWLFQNANTGWNQPPKPPCAPVLTGGPVVDAVWRRLLDRSGPRPGMPLTDDPDLHVLAGGRLIMGRRSAEATYLFDLPARPGELRVVSRTGIPAELGLARDFRRLGVAVRRIALRQGTRFSVLQASDPRLGQGFHAYEPENGWRWTDGDATLPATLFAGFDGPVELMLLLGGGTRYPVYGVPRLDLAG